MSDAAATPLDADAKSSTRDDEPFHLKGNFAPIFEEHDEVDLEVTGSIPPELCGRFFRNGSNPPSGTSPHWFLGQGMIHGIALEGGKVSWYRNRYVRTPLFTHPEAGRMLDDGTMDRRCSFANTHVIRHANRILALEEGSFPFEVDHEVESVGSYDFDGRLKSAMTAHPRICPETGELLFFGSPGSDGFISYHRVAADGELVQSEKVPVKGSTMMHDWNVTRNHVIFMDLPMVFDVAAFEETGMPVRWSDDYGARLGVLPRNGRGEDVTWYEIDPCYVFHTLNAHEEGDRIILDVCRIAEMGSGPASGDGSPPLLHRWTIDTAAGTVSEEPLTDKPADFPRTSDEVVGLKQRYGYFAGLGSDRGGIGAALHKADLETGNWQTQNLAAGCQAGEPVFAANPGGGAEDDGWILTYVYDATRDKSDFVIFDATNLEKPPVARIHLPFRVPFGFHGSWLAD
jgi:carotenoid cleavage dioxygenase-like enzyme